MTIRNFAAAACMAAAGYFMLVLPAQSASDGSLGATSSGTAGVTVTIPSIVRITGLADLSIASYSGPSSYAADDVCVYSNTGNYTITVTTVEAAFSLVGVTDNTKSIAYSVEWAATSGATSGATLAYNTASASQSTGGANLNCSGSANSTLIVRVNDADVGTASAQDYAGTLNLTVAPI